MLNATFPYMMAGLAAMVLVLCLSMAVLVCCYWRILAAGAARMQGGHEDQAATSASATENATPAIGTKLRDEEWSKVVVIMAGDNTPSFLALPKLLEGTKSETVQQTSMDSAA